MVDEQEVFYVEANHARYRGQADGHYESFFHRANHPDRPLAFWIRYTIFSPAGRPSDAVGELWAVFFNGETNRHVAVKKELPFRQCVFATSLFDVRVGEARLSPFSLAGAVYTADNGISWDLSYGGDSRPLLFLPLELYRAKLPKAKSLVPLPLASYNGTMQVNGETIEIRDWVGSQNHNWGSKHTDLYAWGQVAGFDSYPGSFLEVATAKLKFGPFWTPALTLLVLRHDGREYCLNTLRQAFRARGSFEYFRWSFSSKTPSVEIEGTVSAPREAVVGLAYPNPPGGIKHCLNTKIAACTLRLKDRERGVDQTLETLNRAAFEILTYDTGHGVSVAFT